MVNSQRSSMVAIAVIIIAAVAFGGVMYFHKESRMPPDVGMPEAPTPDGGSQAIVPEFPSPEPDGPSSSSDPILGTEWMWVRTDRTNTASVTAPAGDKFIISFSKDRTFTSSTDCNRLSGAFVLNGEVLSFGPIAATKMGCPSGTLESEYSQQLSLATSYVIAGNELRIHLNKDYGTMIFMRRTAPNDPVTSAPDLNGSTFRLTSFNGTALSASRNHTVTFKDGNISAKFCNGLGGSYTIENGIIKAPQMIGTQMYCGDPENVMVMEAAFASMLSGGASLTLQGSTLTLTGSKDKMIFEMSIN